jgi:putative SOS response-associated peptidase YedK
MLEPRQAKLMAWGFPSGPSMPLVINARGETLEDKRLFKDAFVHRRCIVPADGFYEWKKEGKLRHPMRITPQRDQFFFFGGLWVRTQEETPRDVFCIITTAANQKMQALHTRMPLILPETNLEQWLDPKTSGTTLSPLIQPAPEESIDFVQVEPVVNDVKAEGPQCFTKARAVQGELF